MLRHLSIAAAILMATGLAAGPALSPARAGEASARLEVTARVPPALRYALLSAADGFTLTAADLSAGYKDLDTPAVIAVTTNDTAGFLLELSLPRTPAVGQVEVSVSGPGAGATLRAEPGATVSIPVPYPGAGEAVTEVAFRLHLLPRAEPGTHPFPVAVALAPL
jgi:hypothetical protein